MEQSGTPEFDHVTCSKRFLTKKDLSWDGSASCNGSDGELAAVGYSGSV